MRIKRKRSSFPLLLRNPLPFFIEAFDELEGYSFVIRNRYFSATHKGLPYGRAIFGMAYGRVIFGFACNYSPVWVIGL